jgi:hypothetical protein
VAATARAAGVAFGKEGGCFTDISDPAGLLPQLADTLAQPAAVGRLGQVCDRWICLRTNMNNLFGHLALNTTAA